jgi:uncharacterized protein (DUF885 family)
VNTETKQRLKPAQTGRVLAALLVIMFSVPAAAVDNADAALERLASDYVAALPELSPVNATILGDHSKDDQLDDVSAAGRAALHDILTGFSQRLDDIEWDELTEPNQIDAAILSNQLASDLFAMDSLREWSWNPMLYVNTAGTALYGLMARDFAPIDERLNNAAARLQQLPRFLQQARHAMQADLVPKIHAETAVAQNQGIISIIDNMIVPQLDALSGDSRLRLETALETAITAIAEHQSWLEDELLPRAAGDFRIGAELFDAKLRFALDSPLGRKEIKLRAENEYTVVRNEMYEISKAVYLDLHPYSSFPDAPDEAFKQVIIRAALEQAYLQLPEPGGIVDVAKLYLQQASDFVVENNIVTMPDDPIDIIIMPEFQRGISVAYLDPAGPLDEGAKSFYAVAPLPSDWTEEQIRSFLREYNLLSIQDLTIHEAVPGHYLQLALSNRYPSVLRSVLWSGPFVEGWGVYAEQMMIEEGYMDHDPLMRLINLKWYLRAVTNAIIDQEIHVAGMSRDAAMKLMIEGGFQEEREAAGKWVRAQLSSTQLSTYFVGYQEHIDMRRAVEASWGDEFTLRRYHDQALSYGSPPVKYVRALMLGTAIPRTGRE